jgi:hypothetical protein
MGDASATISEEMTVAQTGVMKAGEKCQLECWWRRRSVVTLKPESQFTFIKAQTYLFKTILVVF